MTGMLARRRSRREGPAVAADDDRRSSPRDRPPVRRPPANPEPASSSSAATVVPPAIAGVAAAAVGLGGGELLAGLWPGSPSLLLSVGDWVIGRLPPPVEDAAIGLVGRYDKVALVVTMTVVALGAGAVVGSVAVRRFRVATLVFLLGGCGGTWAALARSSTADGATVISGLGAVGAGLMTLRLLLRPAAARAEADAERRRTLRVLLGAAGLGVVGAGTTKLVARLLTPGSPATVASLRPPPSSLARAPGATSFDDVPGITPLFTSNKNFYRIDTALMVPRVDVGSWSLDVKGMVDRPYGLSYAELSEMPQVESDVTLCCVSDEVGGNLIGNARWQGVPLSDVLGPAGVQAGATQIVARSVDGWTAGFPSGLVMNSRSALIALGMNGEPLPLAHGFPARLVVPGLYGYVSATKWLSTLELTTLEAFDGYWVERGWAKFAPIIAESRIDVPRWNQRLTSGPQVIAGVAWAPVRGIAGVEVSVDEGPWQKSVLADELTPDTWRQWRYVWNAGSGRHTARVRAITADGDVQTERQRPPHPGGATGYHSVQVRVD